MLRYVAISAVLLAPFWPDASAQEFVRNKVLLIGIDGCRPDALRKAKTPSLDGLIRQGASSFEAQTGDITVSGPGWASLLTGVWRSKHGVRDNKFEGANFQEYPHFFRGMIQSRVTQALPSNRGGTPCGKMSSAQTDRPTAGQKCYPESRHFDPRLFRRLKQRQPQAFTASVVHWAPINTAIVTDAYLVVSVKEDRQVTGEAEKILRKREPDAVFVHFDDVDEAGHQHGFHPTVVPYVCAIEQTDLYVGRLLQAVRSRKTYARENWLVLVSTDHGGSGKGHGRNVPEHRTIFVIVSGPSATRGKIDSAPAIVDIAATALEHLGIPLDSRWGLDGRPVGLTRKRRVQP